MIGRTVLHFEILDELGRGGMGVVYKARDTRLQRTVALKFLRSKEDPSRLRPLIEEAIAASRLRVDSVVTVHADYDSPWGSFLCMEYLPGGSLSRRIAREPLQLEPLLRIGIAVTRALEAAHAAGILHCDLKPGNVLLGEEITEAKVADFGLSRFLARPDRGARRGSARPAGGVPAGPESRTRSPSEETTSALGGTMRVGGTIGYMSPEQLRGEPLDARSDLYALGVLLFEAATGRNPVRRAMAAHRPVARELRSGRRVRRDVPAAFWKLVEQLVRDERGERPKDAGAVLRVLRRLRTTVAARDAEARPTHRLELRGRSEETSSLAAALDDLFEGRGSAFLIEGEPGAGKSALAEWTVREALERGAAVLKGRCLAPSDARPFGPLLDAVEGFVDRERGDRSTESYLRHELGLETAAALSALIRTVESPPDGSVHPRDGMRGLVRGLARERSVVLIVDDLHRADAGTAELLTTWSAAAAEIPLLLVATWNPHLLGQSSGTPQSVAEMKDRFEIGGLARTMPLRPLDRRATEKLLRAHLPELPAGHPGFDQAYWRSGGSPGFVVELARLARRSGSTAAELERVLEGALPESIRAAIALRIEQLRPAERDLLRAAAVAGERFELSLLSDVGLGTASALARRLDRLASEQYLIRAERDRCYRFDSPQIREYLLAVTTDEERSKLHGKFADAPTIRADEALPERCAEQLLGAGRGREAGRYLRRAAESALTLYAEEEALRLARLAERNLPTGRQGETALRDVCLIRARALESLGRFPEALAHAERADRLASSGRSGVAKGETLAMLGYLRFRLGDAGRAERALREAEQRFRGSRGSRGLARVLLTRGHLRFQSGRLKAARRYYLQAHDAAKRARDSVLVGRVQSNLANVAAAEGDLGPAEESYREAFEILHGAGDRRAGAAIRGNLALVLLKLGRIDEARSLFREALRAGDEIGDRAFVVAMELRLTRVHLVLGDTAAAAEHSKRAREIAARVGSVLLERRVSLFGAECARMTGALVRAERRLKALLEPSAEPPGKLELDALRVLVRVQLQRGDVDAAEESVDQALQLANKLGSPTDRLSIDRSRAWVRLGRRRHRSVLQLLEARGSRSSASRRRHPLEDVESAIERSLLVAAAASHLATGTRSALRRLADSEAADAATAIAHVADELGASSDRRRYVTRWQKVRRLSERLASGSHAR